MTEVYPPSSTGNGAGEERLFSATMCIPKNKLYESIGDLRKVREHSMTRHFHALQPPVCHLSSILAVDVEIHLKLRKICLFVLKHSMVQIGGSGVLVQPMTYIFDEEPERWSRLLKELES